MVAFGVTLRGVKVKWCCVPLGKPRRDIHGPGKQGKSMYSPPLSLALSLSLPSSSHMVSAANLKRFSRQPDVCSSYWNYQNSRLLTLLARKLDGSTKSVTIFEDTNCIIFFCQNKITITMVKDICHFLVISS